MYNTQSSHVLNLSQFVSLLLNLAVALDYLLVSFNVMSLFTRIPIPDFVKLNNCWSIMLSWFSRSHWEMSHICLFSISRKIVPTNLWNIIGFSFSSGCSCCFYGILWSRRIWILSLQGKMLGSISRWYIHGVVRSHPCLLRTFHKSTWKHQVYYRKWVK